MLNGGREDKWENQDIFCSAWQWVFERASTTTHNEVVSSAQKANTDRNTREPGDGRKHVFNGNAITQKIKVSF